MSQVRLQPTVVQNVVTYSTVITVPNLALKLKPGMTANVNIEILRRNGVLRVANAAMRFRPEAEMFSSVEPARPAPSCSGPARAHAADRRAPAAAARHRSSPSATARRHSRRLQRRRAPVRTTASKATTIDALFAPLTTNESRGMVWRYDGNQQLKAVRLRLGATDGMFTGVERDRRGG